MTTELQERILSITGHTSDINEALDEMESMKTAIGELFDSNQALEIFNRRLRLCLTLAETAVMAMQAEAGMFITEKTRGKANKFFEQFAKTENAIVLSQLIQEKSL
jgi:regulator of replication initiation timing